MNYEGWKNLSFANVLEYNMLAVDMTEDAAAQLSAEGAKIHRSIPVNYKFGIIATSADESKFLKITTEDLRDNDSWFDKVTLQQLAEDRMTAEGDPEFCSWSELGERAAKYLR